MRKNGFYIIVNNGSILLNECYCQFFKQCSCLNNNNAVAIAMLLPIVRIHGLEKQKNNGLLEILLPLKRNKNSIHGLIRQKSRQFEQVNEETGYYLRAEETEQTCPCLLCLRSQANKF